MNIKVDFDNIVVKEDRNDTTVKILMLKGEKGDKGDGENNVIEEVQVNGTALPVSNKAVNVPVPTVDSAINSSSENPVQNKAIYNALNGKVNNSDLNNYYQISEIDNLLNSKVDTSDLDNYYTKTVADGLLNNKANATDVGNIANLTTIDKTSIVNAINELNDPTKLVSVSATAPTNGERIWFFKGKNLFNINDTINETQNASVVIDGNTLKQTNMGTYARTGWIISNLKINEQHVLNLSFINTNSSSVIVRIYKSDKTTIITQSSTTTNTSGDIELSFTTTESSIFVRFYSNASATNNNYEVDFTNIQLEQGNATTYEPYIEQSIYVDKNLLYQKPTVLYNNVTGATTGNITLNDSVANYSCVDVVFSIDGFSENTRNYIRLEKYNVNTIWGGLMTGQVDGSGSLRVWATRITLSNNSATLDRDTCLVLTTSGITTQNTRIKVLKILGYK